MLFNVYTHIVSILVSIRIVNLYCLCFLLSSFVLNLG